MISRPYELFSYVVDMLLITGFENHLQITGIDVGGFPGPVVVYRYDVGSHAGDDAGNADQLAGVGPSVRR